MKRVLENFCSINLFKEILNESFLGKSADFNSNIRLCRIFFKTSKKTLINITAEKLTLNTHLRVEWVFPGIKTFHANRYIIY